MIPPFKVCRWDSARGKKLNPKSTEVFSVTLLFEGEKTPVFWFGLVVFGYSVFQFCNAIWQIVYSFLILPATYPQQFLPSGSTSYTDYLRLISVSQSVVPSVISGIIFLIVGLTIMRAGVRKPQESLQEKQTEAAT